MKNCLLLLEGTSQYIELDPAKIQNTKTLATFLKRGESIENKKFLLTYLTSKIFLELKGYLAKLFSNRVSVLLVFVSIFKGDLLGK